MALKQDEYKIIQNLFRGLLASAPFLAIADMVKKTAATGQEFNKMSQQIGISVEHLSELKYAAELSETEFESLTRGVGILSKSIANISDEAPAAAETLKLLGINTKDTNGNIRQTYDILLDIADKFQGIEDGAGKTAIAMKLFGRGGKEMVPLLNEGSDGIKRMAEEAQKLGIVFSKDAAKAAKDFHDNITELKAGLEGFAISIGNKVIPALNKFFELFHTGTAGYTKKMLFEPAQQELKKLEDIVSKYEAGTALGKVVAENIMAAPYGGIENVRNQIEALKKTIIGYEMILDDLEGKSKEGGIKTPAPEMPWDTEKIEKHFKDIWDTAEKGIQELAKTINEPLKEQIDNLSELKSKTEEYYNEAIAKAKEYAEVAKQAGEISKGMRDYLEGRKVTKLSPEAAMEAESEAVKRGYLKGTTLEDYQEAFQKGQAFLEKYTGQAGRSYETQVSQIEDFMSSIAGKVEDIKRTNEGMAQSFQDKAASLLSTVDTINARITELQNKLIGTKFDIDVTESLKSIQSLADRINSLYDLIKNVPEMVIPAKIASSPAVPFSEGIAYMKEQLGSLPTGADFTIDMSSLTGMFEKLQVLSGLAQTEKMGDIGWGIAKTGKQFPWAGALAGKMQNMIDNLFNVGMVQAFSGIFSQLHGHEKIDSMLQDLIEGYLGNIRSFQGLTSPIEFQRPSFIQVHEGEKLYPAGKTENNNVTFSNTYNFGDIGNRSPESLAKQVDKIQADMIRYGRSETIKAIRKKMRKQ